MMIKEKLENKGIRWALAVVFGVLLTFGTAGILSLFGENPLEGSGFAVKAIIFALSYTLSLYVILGSFRKRPVTSNTADRV